MACARGVKAGPTKAIIIRSDRILFTRDILTKVSTRNQLISMGASGLLKKYIIKTEAHKPYNDPPGSD
jgi:hypothetical protein